MNWYIFKYFHNFSSFLILSLTFPKEYKALLPTSPSYLLTAFSENFQQKKNVTKPKVTSGLPVTKSNGWFSPHLTSALSTILYCWQFPFFMLILFTFLPLLSIMSHCLDSTPISLANDFSVYFAGSSTSNHPLNVGPNLFSLYNCSLGNFTKLQL